MRQLKLVLFALVLVLFVSVAGQILWGDSIMWGTLGDGGEYVVWGT